MGRVPTCNCIETSDGINFALRWVGYWIGNMRVACNRPAVAVGVWRRWPDERTFGYLCEDHLPKLEYLPFEPEIRRPWFEVIGKVKG